MHPSTVSPLQLPKPRTHLSALCVLPAPALECVLCSGLRAFTLQALQCAAAEAGVLPEEFQALQRATAFSARAMAKRTAAGRIVAAANVEVDGGEADYDDALAMLAFFDRLHSVLPDNDAEDGNDNIETSVWSSGRNASGVGARPGEGDVNVVSPTASPSRHGSAFDILPFVSVSAGGHHSAAITAGGEMFVTGSNEAGQLGLGHISNAHAWTSVAPVGLDAQNDGRMLPASARIASVSCGLKHTIVVTGSGHVYSCGDNELGQCGVGTNNQIQKCYQQNRGKDRISMSRSRNHLLYEDPNSPPSRVLQLTAVRGVTARNDAALWLGGVSQVAAGFSLSLVLLADGRVLAAGQCNELGMDGGAEFAPVDCFGYKIARVGVGGIDTVMLVTANNMVLVTGKRKTGLSVIGGLGCGLVSHLSIGDGFAIARTDEGAVIYSRNRKRFEMTEEFFDIYAVTVSAGARHYALVTCTGGVMACGSNAFGAVAAGQMGLTLQGGVDARVIRPFVLPLSDVDLPPGFHALDVSAGAFHTLYLLAKDHSNE
jgi:alpha-tubulin suppressor-like RCC1 family protein